MTSLSYKARLAIEGSDRSETAFEHVRDYLADLNDRTLFEVSDGNLGAELGGILRLLKDHFDPEGSSPYRLELVRRGAERGGRPPNPQGKRVRQNDAMFAALYADRMLVADPTMQKKWANSRAAEALGVTIAEVHAARKQPNYESLREWNLTRNLQQATEK